MWTCTICRLETELDDVVVTMANSHCICLRCFVRETGGAQPMPKALRRELIATLAEAEPVGSGS
jgi:hypothetical protein